MVIVETLKQWWRYLEGTNYKILHWCNDQNIEYFQTFQVLSRKQTRWSEILSAYNFAIESLEGTKHHADGPCSRPDYMIGFTRPVA
jgi:hypothetical protein